MLIGVDTGGTFTDLVVLLEDGSLVVHKVPSTPADPAESIAVGLRLCGAGPGCDVVHGTTVATNALLERRGAKTALITTQGCRDVLEIARQTRDSLYSLCPAPRNPLIPRELRFEVTERLDWRGEVITPLDTDSVERALDEIQGMGVESVAVCLLFSFLNPEHEREVGRRAQEQGMTVSLSCDVAPEYREYERTSTVCANAFVAPVMAGYIDRLSHRLQVVKAADPSEIIALHPTPYTLHPASRLSVMQSDGGTLRAAEAAEIAVKTVLSGPAGGLVAATRVCRDAGFERIITFDMGGTSTDVALVDGEPVTVRTGEVAGIPLLTPMLDIHTVGAGGGSLVRIDAADGLRVGPESAGADPGPVAYGRGEQLTVTDANVLLGRLPAGVRLAGSLELDRKRVAARFDSLGKQLGITAEEAAAGVLEVVNAQMARALRHISVERGRDPADYTLVAFGGAGGLHACALAESLGMARILIPRFPGAFSALGLALADVRREYTRSLFLPAIVDHDSEVTTRVAEMTERANAEIAGEGVSRRAVRASSFVEMRYVGQSYALRVSFRQSLAQASRAFHREHRERYGHSDPGQAVECVAVGVTAVGARNRPQIRIAPPEADTQVTPTGESAVWLERSWAQCPIFARESLPACEAITGPALVLQDDSTTWISPGWNGEVDSAANLVLKLNSDTS